MFDKTHLVGLVIEPQHIWQIHQMWKAIGKDCPWALCLGVSPELLLCLTDPGADAALTLRFLLRPSWPLQCPSVRILNLMSSLPRLTFSSTADGVSEAGYIGAFTGSSLEVFKCESNNLTVPASTEIVLEGTLSVTETGPEGPLAPPCRSFTSIH